MTQDTTAFIAALILAFAIGGTAAAPCLVEALNRPPISTRDIAGTPKTDQAKQHHAQSNPEMTSPMAVPTGSAYSNRDVSSQHGRASQPDNLKITDVIQAISAAVSSAAAGALVWIGFNQKKVSSDQAEIMRSQQEIMARQWDIGLATQRAWVGAIVKVAGPIKVSDGAISGSFTLELSNCGTLPANVDRPCIAALPWDMNQATSDDPRVTYVINCYKVAPLLRHGVIFPQQSVNEPFQIEIRRCGIDIAINTMTGFVPVIRGTIRYDYPSSTQVHYTTFHVHVVRTPDPSAPSAWHPIPIDDGVIIPPTIFS